VHSRCTPQVSVLFAGIFGVFATMRDAVRDAAFYCVLICVLGNVVCYQRVARRVLLRSNLRSRSWAARSVRSPPYRGERGTPGGLERRKTLLPGSRVQRSRQCYPRRAPHSVSVSTPPPATRDASHTLRARCDPARHTASGGSHGTATRRGSARRVLASREKPVGFSAETRVARRGFNGARGVLSAIAHRC